MLKSVAKIKYRQHSIFFAEKPVLLHSMLTSCGRQLIKTTDYYWDGMKRGKNELIVWQYTIAGRGCLDYEGKNYDLLPGTAMIVHIPHNHKYYFPKDSEFWDFIYVCLNGREIVRIFCDVEKKAGPIIKLDEQDETIRTVLEIFSHAVKQDWKSANFASSLAYQMGMSLIDDTSKLMAVKNKKPDFIKKVTNYCLEHFESPLTVDDLCEVAGYSRYHFSRLFTEHMGLSPAAFLKELRLRHAVRLLQTELLPIKEIAFRCGFESASYFCRAFQKEFRMSPGEFRKGGK